jgi:ParB family chromosome partitioning protein
MDNALQSSIARLGSKLEDHKKDAVLLKVALDDLIPYKRQARTSFNEEALQEMAESMRDVGVIEPLLVRPLGGGKYEIIAGERRWRAARIAGLTHVPVLAKPIDDETADKLHLIENIHRENLSTLDLAQRVQEDLDAANGDLAKVAAKYNKQKPWVSKLSAIAQGGEAMNELVVEGVTADRAVLAAVSSLERKAPEQAAVLTEELKAAPAKANKRAITERFMKEQKEQRPTPKPARGRSKDQQEDAAQQPEPAWRGKAGVNRQPERALVRVELSPLSDYAGEFQRLSTKHGEARLASTVRHPNQAYAIVEFGPTEQHRRVYRANELRLLAVF